MGKYVLMISPNNFPNGDAGAVRDDCFAKIYQELGYQVIHIGMNPNIENIKYENTICYSIYKNNDGIFRKFKNSVTYRKRLKKICVKILENNGYPNLIHIYDIPKSGIEFARKLAIKNRIKIVHDSVEWYSPCEFKWGIFSYPYYLKNRTNTKLIRKPMNVYAISIYLENYYKNKELKTLRVPVLMDVMNTEIAVNRIDSKLSLIYAGSPANKDYLKEMVLAVESLSFDEKEKLKFNIYGATNEDIKIITGMNELSNCIEAHGRVSREEVKKALLNADFSPLLRPENERYTKAGFPTKSVEAMSHGVAMMCNLTSDLEMYLNDGENALIVDGCSAVAMTASIRRALHMNQDRIRSIKTEARKTAENNFDYRKWISSVQGMIGDQ